MYSNNIHIFCIHLSAIVKAELFYADVFAVYLWYCLGAYYISEV